MGTYKDCKERVEDVHTYIHQQQRGGCACCSLHYLSEIFKGSHCLLHKHESKLAIASTFKEKRKLEKM